jgi:hypothetical protein
MLDIWVHHQRHWPIRKATPPGKDVFFETDMGREFILRHKRFIFESGIGGSQ